MAITLNHILLLLSLRESAMIGGGKTDSILELGEQNWFGDVDPSRIINDVRVAKYFTPDLIHRWENCLMKDQGYKGFTLVKFFYEALFEYTTYRAFDFHGSEIAEKIDLNYPIQQSERFDIVTNFGTSEHIFNQYQVFKTIHDVIKPGGLILFGLPNQGQYDHGFYNYHPTFFFDLAKANNYGVSISLISGRSLNAFRLQLKNVQAYHQFIRQGEIPSNSGLLGVFVAPMEKNEFQIPQQGYYDDSAEKRDDAFWNELSRG